MGLFKKLFSNENNESKKESKIVRDHFKNDKYFSKELKRVNDWINRDLTEYETSEAQNKEILTSQYDGTFSTTSRKMNILYSAGYSIEEVKECFEFSIKYLLLSWNKNYNTYSDLLDVISKAILLEVSNEYLEQIRSFTDRTELDAHGWFADALLDYMLHSVFPERDISEKLIWSNYKKLFDITKLDPQEAPHKIKSYLDSWYSSNKNASWHGSHLREWGYSGYWCWEAATIVKIMSLDDSSFKDHEFYPYDMVHWKLSK